MNLLGKTRNVLRHWARELLRTVRGHGLLYRIQASCPAERIGSGYGGWTICPDLVDRDSIVYSFGVGEDLTFDQGIIDRYQVQVYAFDPTPRSVAWVRAQSLPAGLHFMDCGIADFNGTASFFPPAVKEHVSHSILRRPHNTGDAVEVPVKRLSTIMDELGHTRLDILKMDIEGAEYGVIDDMLKTSVRPPQILVEFHHRFESVGIRKTITTIRRLNREGYRIFSISPNHEEFSFILTGRKMTHRGTAHP